MPTYSKLLALFAFAVFVAYLAVVVIRVPRLDLHIVIGLTVLLVVYDLWTEIGKKRKR